MPWIRLKVCRLAGNFHIDKQCSEFIHHIAEAQRCVIREMIAERVCELYPGQPSSLTEIKFCHQDKGKQLMSMVGYNSLADLIKLVGKSTVIIQLRIDLAVPPNISMPTVTGPTFVPAKTG